MNQEDKKPLYSIIPYPAEIIEKIGEFSIDNNTQIISPKSLFSIAAKLQYFIFQSSGINLEISEIYPKDQQIKTIIFSIFKENETNKKIGTEGYLLKIEKNAIHLSANQPAGIFYGIQTIRQLLPPEIEENQSPQSSSIRLNLPSLEIQDYPRFPYRGYMLDEGRYFLGKVAVKKMLDLMALFKMNTFRWHLTEDQGWRIEIKKYPKLTDIGSKLHTPIKPRLFSKNDKISNPLGGYYTQEEVKEIIDYAKSQFITIIPEIEMPGHSTAAIAAYPNISCRGENIDVSHSWGVKHDVYCAGKEETYEFLQNILDEIITLFPSEIIHTGGDEVPKERWNNCPHCQAKIKAEHLKDSHALQRYFTNRISNYLAAKNRRLMGWDEIIDEGLDPNAICQFWHGNYEKIIPEIKKGRKVVNSWNKFMYIDYPYKLISLQKAYSFDPIPDELEDQFHGNILGLEAPMWGEVDPNILRMEWQSFPRVCAYAETGWSPKNIKNYSSFERRLNQINKRLDYMKVNYAKLSEANPSLWQTLKILICKKGFSDH